VLLQHPHIGHHHPPVHRLAHVINGQQPHLHRGQRPRLVDGFDLHGARLIVDER
jgi:hypothetical protein